MYAVVGRGTAPQPVINESLEDIGIQLYALPWYKGAVSTGLSNVYDWVLDTGVPFLIVKDTDAKAVPKVLASKAMEIQESENVSDALIILASKNQGTTLVMWDTEDEEESVRIATLSIDKNLPTLELTNGMVPIVFDEMASDAPDNVEDFVVETDSDLPVEKEDEEDVQFTREEMENMPAAVVKRRGTTIGMDIKSMTKGQIIDAIYGTTTEAGVTKDSIEDRLSRIEELLLTLVNKM